MVEEPEEVTQAIEKFVCGLEQETSAEYPLPQLDSVIFIWRADGLPLSLTEFINELGTTMRYNTLDYTVSDRILLLTLNNPEKMNAFTVEMCNELIDA